MTVSKIDPLAEPSSGMKYVVGGLVQSVSGDACLEPLNNREDTPFEGCCAGGGGAGVVSMSAEAGPTVYVAPSLAPEHARYQSDIDRAIPLFMELHKVCHAFVTVAVVNGIATFDSIEVYEGTYIKSTFTVDSLNINQRYIFKFLIIR